MQIRYKEGTLEEVDLLKPIPKWQQIQTSSEVLKEMDALLDSYITEEVAEILNKRGYTNGVGLPFNARLVAGAVKRNGIKGKYERLREQGLLTLVEVAQKLNVNPKTIKKWFHAGLIQRRSYSLKNEYLFTR